LWCFLWFRDQSAEKVLKVLVLFDSEQRSCLRNVETEGVQLGQPCTGHKEATENQPRERNTISNSLKDRAP
jgi:hypothetical protein